MEGLHDVADDGADKGDRGHTAANDRTENTGEHPGNRFRHSGGLGVSDHKGLETVQHAHLLSQCEYYEDQGHKD